MGEQALPQLDPVEVPQYQAQPVQTQQAAHEPLQRKRASSVRPAPKSKAMISDAASTALRRAFQSSPARWMGTEHGPIEVEEDLGSTRRLLFPSPRKEGVHKVLCEVATNTDAPATEFRSPKDVGAAIFDKENCPPPFDEDVDMELMKLFEEEIARPSTPLQRTPPANPFKTPTRPTPNHRPVTRSQSRSARSASKFIMFSQRTPSKTPSSAARRRSPRNHHGIFESPFTSTLNELLAKSNNQDSPSRHLGMDLDFSSLPQLDQNMANMPMNFHLPGFDNEDFFSTDVPMPSSPPRLFNLYEDPLNLDPSIWNQFDMSNHNLHSTNHLGSDAFGNSNNDGANTASSFTTQIMTIEKEETIAEDEQEKERNGNEQSAR